MDISVGANSLNPTASNYVAKSTKASDLESTLNNSKNATDEQLMDSCKSFESYLLEQVFKGMENTVTKSDEEEQDDYMSQFGDMLYEKYAEDATDKQSLGIAQMLYDSMKRNS